MKTRKLFVAVVLSFIGLWWFSGSDEVQDTKYLFDRPWVSDLPDDPREMHHAMFLSSKHKKVGATVVGSQYQHLVSVVGYDLKKEKLHLNFLQQEFKIAGGVKTWKCKGPKKLDLCMEINYRWKKVRLYSSTKWSHAKHVPAHLRLDLSRYQGLDTACTGCTDGEPRWLSTF